MEDIKASVAITIKMDINNTIDTIKKIRILTYKILINTELINIHKTRYQFEINLFATAYLTQLAITLMRNSHSARVINGSSIAGKMYTPLGTCYHASKHALEAWSDCLRLELKSSGIDVSINKN